MWLTVLTRTFAYTVSRRRRLIHAARMARSSLLLLLAACRAAPTSSPPPPAVAAQAPAPRPVDPSPPGLRLPGDVQPRRFELELTIDPASEGFAGKVRVEAEVVEPTRVVWLNATDLSVSSAKIDGQSVRVLPGGADHVGLVGDRELTRGSVVLELAFTGKIDRERSRGVYAVKEPDGAWYAYTFFESLDARRAFPCFDEPIYKVPWRLTLRVPPGQVALANAPIASDREAGGLREVVFAESKPMPSYLVAFVVGPFDVIDGGTGGRAGTRIQFVVPRGRGPETRWAREVTPRVVAALEDYFDMPYPYEKLDVAVPPRYWGTMEHPGIVAMGQVLTLIPPDRETRSRRQFYTVILAHELAHYWFGDYVTMSWWDDTWLNEALGQWMDPKITHAVEPSWRYLDDIVRQATGAMNGDELLATKAIIVPVDSKEAIADSFDADITYFKGSAVLAMFEHWVGPEEFQRFIRGWVRKHAWATADRGAFFAEARGALGADAEAGLRSFLEQPGLPVIDHELQCQSGKATLRLRQRRSLPAGVSDPTERLWKVPVCVRHGAGRDTTRQCAFLAATEGQLALEGACPDWLVMNADARGYYRSGYRAEELARLFAARRPPPLTRRERLMTLSDLSAGIERAELPVAEGLALVPTLARDADDRIVRSAMGLSGLAAPQHLDEADHARYQRFILAVFGKRARALGWKRAPGDSDERHELRASLAGATATAGDARMAREADRLARAWLADPRALDEDLVEPALGAAARRGDDKLFDAYVDAVRTRKSQHERTLVAAQLGAFTDPALAERARGLILGSGLDLRDTHNVILVQVALRETRAAAWTWLEANLERVIAGMRDDEAAQLIGGSVSTLCDAAGRDRALKLMSPIADRIEGARGQLDRAIQRVERCTARRSRDQAGVRKFLARY